MIEKNFNLENGFFQYVKNKVNLKKKKKNSNSINNVFIYILCICEMCKGVDLCTLCTLLNV